MLNRFRTNKPRYKEAKTPYHEAYAQVITELSINRGHAVVQRGQISDVVAKLLRYSGIHTTRRVMLGMPSCEIMEVIQPQVKEI